MLHGFKLLIFCASKIYADVLCEYIASLNQELAKQNWRMIILCTETDLQKDTKHNQGQKKIFDLINYQIADALLISDKFILDNQLKNKIVFEAKNNDVPVFLLDGIREDCFNIIFNETSGFERICRHVIEYHRTRDIHFIAGTKDSVESQARLNALKRVLKDNNIPFSSDMISYGDFWDGPTRAAVEKLIKEERVPRAIICANDTMAISATSVLKENGFYCPEDVIVTGFDGIKSVNFSSPKITTAKCDLKLIGFESARIITKVFKEKSEPFTFNVEPTIHISESCGCCARRQTDTLKYTSYISDSFSRYRIENTLLNNLAVTIRDSQNLDEVIENLKNDLLYNVMILVKEECVDSSLNPTLSHTKSTYGDKMFLLADSDYKDKISNRFVNTSDYIPRFQELLEHYDHPFIFTPIHNTELPLGYACFFFQNYDQQNYTKIFQTASCLGSAISGYQNTQYLKYLQVKLEQTYKYDSLTGLYNRNGFVKIYEQIMKDDSISTLTMVLSDLDNLKYINDNFSHNEGDNAINIVGKALSTARDDGIYCRYGGDEIIGLFTKEISAEQIKEKISSYLENYNMSSGKLYTVSTSVGVFTSNKIPFEELFAKADKVMYKEKRSKASRRAKK